MDIPTSRDEMNDKFVGATMALSKNEKRWHDEKRKNKKSIGDKVRRRKNSPERSGRESSIPFNEFKAWLR